MRYKHVITMKHGLHTVPNLFLRRCIKIPLEIDEASGIGKRGRRSGTRKSDKEREPSDRDPVLARAIVTCESVADENHLKPLRIYGVPTGTGDDWSLEISGIAVVSLCERSDPPGFSVIHWPEVKA